MIEENLPVKRERTLDLAMFPAAQDAGSRQDLTQEVMTALITWSSTFGLDAWAGHTCYMYGKPYVTERGAQANAEKYQAYQGYTMRRVKGEELADLDLEHDDIVWECAVDRRDRSQPIIEYGVVTRRDIDGLAELTRRNVRRRPESKDLDDYEIELKAFDSLSYLPLWRNPNNMARVRAIRRAHLSAFPLQGYEMGER